MAHIDRNWTADLIFDTLPSIWSSDGTYQTTGSFKFDFFTASTFGEYDYVKRMIDSEEILDINQKNHGQWTALMYAVYYGHPRLLELLLQHNASIHTSNDKGRNVLMVAARCGNEAMVGRMIMAGSFLEARDNEDWTALHHAIYAGDFSVVRTLLEHGANPNACERKTWKSPLMYACLYGDYNIVEILLRNRASTGLVNTRGQTASQMARNAGHLSVASLIDRWSAEEQIGLSLMDGPKAVESSPFLLNQRRVYEKRITPEAVGAGTISDLETLLTRMGLPAFRNLFKEQQVDFTTFLSLTDQDLKDCGVTKVGPRLKILAGIDRWHNNAPLTTGLEAAYSNKLSSELRHLKEEFEGTSKALKEANKLNDKEKSLRMLAEMKVMEMRSKLQELHDRMRNISSHLIYTLHLTNNNFQSKPLQEATSTCLSQMEELVRVVDVYLQNDLSTARYLSI